MLPAAQGMGATTQHVEGETRRSPELQKHTGDQEVGGKREEGEVFEVKGKERIF